MTREEAIEIIESRNFYCIECIDRSEECCKALDMAIKVLEQQKIGHWVRVGARVDLVECTSCGYRVDVKSYTYPTDKCCPNCGANMKNESEEEE